MAFGETTASRHRLLVLSVVVAMVMTLIEANSRDPNDLASDVTGGFDENELSVDDVIKSRDNEIGGSQWRGVLPGWSREAQTNNYADDGGASNVFRRPDKKLRYGFHAIRGKRQPDVARRSA